VIPRIIRKIKLNETMRRAKTIFLDFDGVLHPSLAEPEQLFLRAELLIDVFKSRRPEVVISSSWRFQMSLDDLIVRLPSEIGSLVCGITGAGYVGKHARWNEIQTYCQLHKISDWRALDDSAFEFPSSCAQLIRVDGARGLTKLEVEQLTDWLDESDA
jgi:hypothetical protein